MHTGFAKMVKAASTNYNMSYCCRECGKEVEVSYGKGIFCSRSCCNRSNANKQVVTKDRLARLARMRSIALSKDSPGGTCRFCGLFCSNSRSLRNHERLCKSNLHRILPRRVLGQKQKQKQNHPKLERSCSFCNKTWLTTLSGVKNHELHCPDNPKRILGSMQGRRHSKDTVAEMKRLIANKDEPTGGWIGLRKRSYAEQYWFEVFQENPICSRIENNYRVGKYILDFANPQSKTYFEVDGETHYTESGILHDTLRTEYLSDRGWTLIGRCRWSEFIKQSTSSRVSYAQSIEHRLLNSDLVAKVVE